MEGTTDRRRVNKGRNRAQLVHLRPTAFLCKTFEEADIQTPDLGFAASYHRWQLLVIADQNHMLRLCQRAGYS
jgi:hypothetical protein